MRKWNIRGGVEVGRMIRIELSDSEEIDSVSLGRTSASKSSWNLSLTSSFVSVMKL